jgi:branched-chain amino acid transport system substrate-binding protein
VTATSIKVALITSLTGSDSSNSAAIPKGFAARIDQQNAQGGVNGRKITWVTEDDQSNPAQAPTAVGVALHAGVFAIDYESPFAFGAAQVMAKQNVPVVGGGYDGPEWTLLPNMFSLDMLHASNPVYTTDAQFIKDKGGTRIASLGYGESPSSKATALGAAKAAKQIGGVSAPYVNVSLPFGTVDVGAISLAMKSANVDSLYGPIDGNTLLAVLTGAEQTGVKFKVAILATGYGQPLLDDPQAVQSAQGAYFYPGQTPIELHTPATVAEQAAFKQYENFTGVPGFDWSQGYMSADLLIKGLQQAGQNPTRASFTSGLRSVTSYDAGGLLPSPINFSNVSAIPTTACAYYDQLQGNKFVLATAKPVCGTLVP